VKREKKRADITIVGILIPAAWNEDGKAIKVAIQTIEEKEYLVEPNKKGRELLNFIEHEAEATGVAKKDEDGNFIIKIHKYSLPERGGEKYLPRKNTRSGINLLI